MQKEGINKIPQKKGFNNNSSFFMQELFNVILISAYVQLKKSKYK